jgi:hypothetical protein
MRQGVLWIADKLYHRMHGLLYIIADKRFDRHSDFWRDHRLVRYDIRNKLFYSCGHGHR